MNLFRSKEQKNFSGRISSFLVKGGEPLLMEGAAGLGKTRAYLASLVESNKPFVICVPSRALAQQLLISSDLKATCDNKTIEVFKPRNMFETKKEYLEHKASCVASEILICTHQAAIIDIYAESSYIGIKDRHSILFDEADQIPDAASLRLDLEISSYVFDILKIKPTSNYKKTVESVLKKLPKHLDEFDEPALIKAACNGILKAIEDPAWFKVIHLNEGSLKLTHRLPGRIIKSILTHPRLIFVSATLSIGNSFNDFKRSIGIAQENILSIIIEPEVHGHLRFVNEDWNIEDPDHRSKVAEHVRSLKGYTLVLTTNHEDSAILSAMIPNSVVREKVDGEMETAAQAISRMTEDQNVLIGVNAWAGLDTQMKWRNVVIPKVPFGTVQPSIESDTTSSYLNSRNVAIRRFRQGIARGLRSTDAVCTIHLLDQRFSQNQFVSAIPSRFGIAFRERLGTREERIYQSRFRAMLIERFAGKCLISGCSEQKVLEAAHIGPKLSWKKDNVNGLLLRVDLHRLMDNDGLSISDEGIIRILTSDPFYQQYDGKKIEIPAKRPVSCVPI